MRTALVVALFALVTACARDPRSFRITEQNKETWLKDIKDMKGLTVDEARILYADSLRSAFGGSRKVVGKTVGEVLEEIRKEEKEQEAENKRQEKLAAEAKAKEEALATELRKAINLAVVDKGFQKADWEEYITIKVAYENTSGKDIRAFRGRVKFTDLFGKEIYESGFTISDPIKAGEKATWNGSIKYNQFIDKQKSFLLADLKDMKVNWMPAGIIFDDGSKIGSEED